MPSSALSEARALLNTLGYGDDAIASDYPVWLGRNRGVERADLVAFARPEPQDMSTAVIAVETGEFERAFDIARFIAAPYFLFGDDSSFDLWIAESAGPVVLRRQIRFGDLAELGEWLRPHAAMKTKVGLRQLPLFDIPVDLLAAARSDSANRLAPIVSEALAAATAELSLVANGRRVRAKRVGHRAAARLVVGALTVLVLRDRDGAFLRQLGTDDLITQVVADQPSTFRWFADSSAQEHRVMRALVQDLGHGIDYQSLDPSILSTVYEEALVDEADRQNLGIFYTPPKLATQILKTLPVELVPPDERHVLDPACGSGTLLIAAHDRLRDLQSPEWATHIRRHDLAVHLHGYDIDPFAVEIARLTLFLHAQPVGNGWEIDERDTLSTRPSTTRPRLIVTNPPWRFTSDTQRVQAADDFVEWSVDALAPGGLLGILVPGSWLSSAISAPAREVLMERFEVFEIWRLAQGAFANSRSASVVLFARKNDRLGGKGVRAVTEVSRRHLPAFLESQGSRVRYLQSGANTALDRGCPLPTIAVPTQPLGTLATILSGPQPLRAAHDRFRGGVPFLNQFGDVPVYGVVQDAKLWRLEFPGDFQSARGARIIGKKKVLASAARSSEGPWRFRVAVDNLGVAMRNSMRGIAPHDQGDDELLYAIAIIVGSAFGSTFASSFAGDRNIPATVLPALPIPRDRETILALAEIGHKASALSHAPSDLSSALIEGERAVWTAYGISTSDRAIAEARFAGEPAPEGQPRYFERDRATGRARSIFRRVGAVLDVDGNYVRLWVSGLTPDDGVVVPLPVEMPGWLTRAGATFDVTGVAELSDLADGDYTFQPMAWQDLDYASNQPAPIVLQ